MFNDIQIKTLNNELDSKRIKSRQKGNINLFYLEGFDILETANRIFGFSNWEYTISKLEMVSQETNQKQNTVICYKAIIEIIVHDTEHSKQLRREDVGFGTGIAKTLADAHESGAKEAVTDAIKRTLRSFGNQFGNSLYDKSRNQSSNAPQSNNSDVPTQNQDTPEQVHSFNTYEYQSLYSLGLEVKEHNGFLLVSGNDIFSKKDSIKACGFRWDGKTKQWYKQLEQGAA